MKKGLSILLSLLLLLSVPGTALAQVTQLQAWTPAKPSVSIESMEVLPDGALQFEVKVYNPLDDPIYGVELTKVDVREESTDLFAIGNLVASKSFPADSLSKERIPIRGYVGHSLLFEADTVIKRPQANQKLYLSSEVTYYPSLDVKVNGRLLSSDVPPILVNDWTFLPLRAVAEAVNAQVSWDEWEQKVTLHKNGKRLEFWIGKSDFSVDGKPVRLPNPSVVGKTPPAFLYQGRTMVPLRPAAESLGLEVNYEELTWKADEVLLTGY